MATSHAGHNHPATPAARAACRKSNGNPNVTRIESDGSSALDREIYRSRANQAARRRMELASATRIQPRRSGARVTVNSSTCVQAALHTRGRCACGWENWAA